MYLEASAYIRLRYHTDSGCMVIPIFHSWELPIERRHYEGMSLIEHVFNHPEETLNTALKLPKVEKAVNDDRRILRDSQRLEILGEIRIDVCIKVVTEQTLKGRRP